jgi:hypothetical protein
VALQGKHCQRFLAGVFFRVTHSETQLQLNAIANLVRGASRGDAFVFYCEALYDVRLSLVDHNSVFPDAGYCEKQPYGDSNIDVGRDCAMNLFFLDTWPLLR